MFVVKYATSAAEQCCGFRVRSCSHELECAHSDVCTLHSDGILFVRFAVSVDVKRYNPPHSEYVRCASGWLA